MLTYAVSWHSIGEQVISPLPAVSRRMSIVSIAQTLVPGLPDALCGHEKGCVLRQRCGSKSLGANRPLHAVAKTPQDRKAGGCLGQVRPQHLYRGIVHGRSVIGTTKIMALLSRLRRGQVSVRDSPYSTIWLQKHSRLTLLRSSRRRTRSV